MRQVLPNKYIVTILASMSVITSIVYHILAYWKALWKYMTGALRCSETLIQLLCFRKNIPRTNPKHTEKLNILIIEWLGNHGVLISWNDLSSILDDTDQSYQYWRKDVIKYCQKENKLSVNSKQNLLIGEALRKIK